jgi:hypothetical protein
MSETFKSITHGTCALGGRHTSEPLAMECPALGRTANERLQRFRGGDPGVDSRSPETPTSATADSGTSKTVFRHGRAGRSGRPQVPAAEQRRNARERTRTWRARKASAPQN